MKRLPIFLSILLLLTCAKEDSQNPNTSPIQITKQYTITVSAGDGGSVSTIGGTFSQGTEVSITATPNSGYSFVSWSNGSTNNPLNVTLNSNTSVTANFEPIVNSYTLTVSAGEGGSVSSEGGDYEEGTEVTITAIPAEGYRFKKWSDDNYSYNRLITISSNINLSAEYEILPENLISYYNEYGGRDNFNTKQQLALETLLFTHEDIKYDRLDEARKRLDFVFQEIPKGDWIWFSISNTPTNDIPNPIDTHCETCITNIGGPIAYYALRMIDQIVELGNPDNSSTYNLTAVIAPCANVTRPISPNLDLETVNLEISPEILADYAQVLYNSTELFRNWFQAISGGTNLNLQIHVLESCTTVYFNNNSNWYSSYPNFTKMIDEVPIEIQNGTNMWWVIAPSGVPGDGSGYEFDFVTGGMSNWRHINKRYSLEFQNENIPVFISDDAWFIRKPEHMGQGSYHEIEIKAYQPQWFQHEFMHNIYLKYKEEFNLEPYGHSWFDRSTWPSDFDGIIEPDYYYESLKKRILLSNNKIFDVYNAPENFIFDGTDISILLGNYTKYPIENDWHKVEIKNDGGNLIWTNDAGASWSLEILDGELYTKNDCPYGVQKIAVLMDSSNKVYALRFNSELYERD